MAMAATVAWEVRTTGSDTNGGGFNTAASGVDMCQYDNKNSSGGTNCYSTTANLSVTDGVTNGTTTITSALANFTSAIVGNVIHVQGGTGSVASGWYEVTGYTDASTITVDRATGLTAGTGVSLDIGGALGSIGIVGPQMWNSHDVYVKMGTYTITQVGHGVSGGTYYNTSNGTATDWVRIIGYNTNRTDFSARPTIQLGVAPTYGYVFDMTGNYNLLFNFIIDCQGQSASMGWHGGTCYRVKVISATSATYGGFRSTGMLVDCEADRCALGYRMDGGSAFGCTAHDCSSDGFDSYGGDITECLSYRNTGVGYYVSGYPKFYKCVAYGNGSDGFKFENVSTQYPYVVKDCIAVSNSAYGFNVPAARPGLVMRNCAGYNNTSGDYTSSAYIGFLENFKTLTGNPFVNVTLTANGVSDFSLNNVAGAGADCRGAGAGNSLTQAVGYPDIGAIQHRDPVASKIVVKATLILSGYTFNPDSATLSAALGAYEASGVTRQQIGTIGTTTIAQDDTNDLVSATFSNPTFPTVTTGQTLVGMLVYAENGADSTSIPLGFFPFSLTTDGTDVTVTFASGSLKLY